MQRLRLLRLLAGLALIVVLASLTPAVSMVPHWVRAYVTSVLNRAECAVNNLLFVSACLLAGRQPASRALSPDGIERESKLSLDDLLQRIARLRKILNDLPRFAKRLFQRRASQAKSPRLPAICAGSLPIRRAPCPARIDRPPRIGSRISLKTKTPSTRRVWEAFGVPASMA